MIAANVNMELLDRVLTINACVAITISVVIIIIGIVKLFKK